MKLYLGEALVKLFNASTKVKRDSEVEGRFDCLIF